MTIADLYNSFVPEPPVWEMDWDALMRSLPVLQALRGCPQNPLHHGEGDVAVHTGMVVAALIADPRWRALAPDARRVLFWATVLHDIGKPATTREEGGRITSRGHSRVGERMARNLLWRAGVPVGEREAICGLIYYHQQPFFVMKLPEHLRLTIEISLVTRADWLAIHATADMRGRIAADVDEQLLNIALFEDYAREQGCHERPFPFASAHTRMQYFRQQGRDPGFAVYDDTVCEVVLMSGLPGAGKDRFIADNRAGELAGWPAISLDALRREMGLKPGSVDGRLFQAAREAARGYLRAGRSFVWNATNLTRQTRQPLLDLFADYKARTRIVSIEAGPDTVFARNRDRDAGVPVKAIERMLEKWEPPTLLEAHRVDRIVTG